MADVADVVRAPEGRPAPPGRAVASSVTRRRRIVIDRLARWVVTAGGLAVIASILAILVFILVETWPLARAAQVGPARVHPLASADPVAIVPDEYLSHALLVAGDGRIVVTRLGDGRQAPDELLLGPPEAPLETAPDDAPGPPMVSVAAASDGSVLTGATADGRIVVASVRFETRYHGDQRVVVPSVDESIVLQVDPRRLPVGVHAARIDAEGGAAAAAQLADGSVGLVRRTVSENMLTGETTPSLDRRVLAAPARLTTLVMDGAMQNLYGATASGALVWWSLSTTGDPRVVSIGRSPATALSLLIGDRALVVGQADGSLSVWSPIRVADGVSRLGRVRTFPSHPGSIRQIAPSRRDKGFFALDETGRLGLYHSTSERVLWTGSSPIPRATSLAYSPKGDAAVLAGEGRLAVLPVRNRHPEASLKAYFGKVWYEGYANPEYVWQSTGGTDDFEPKLSLVPLAMGTLKGTIYSLILAIPLGVLGAMFASQFLHPALQRWIKPTVEIMAAMPSVVLGFLAGLWLAPRVEAIVPALLVIPAVVVPLLVAAGLLFRRLPLAFRGRFPEGAEIGLYFLTIALGIWGCLAANPFLERTMFGGTFQSWLLQATGLEYDQRNAMVVGLAMGFAVIPIIFAIAEDAFSNVPRNLISGSLALGASRWQTVTRVVLPTASAGIFSAIMIGFGRAVGETMIVLMATGNTPIMDWSPFNGFRTLSANIATEIPEAPHGSTLYRTLFLAALLLFLLTFLVNTVAELVRQHLRRRYAEM